MESPVRTRHHLLLEHLLHTCADHPELNELAPILLHTVCDLMKADASLYALFDDPALVYTNGLRQEVDPRQDALVQRFLVQDCDAPQLLPDHEFPGFVSGVFLPVLVGAEVHSGLAVLYRQPPPSLMEVDTIRAIGRALLSATHHKRLAHQQYQFTRIVSHDLRAPLTVVQGYGSVMAAEAVGALNDQQKQYLDKILSSVQEMDDLVEQIQAASRFDPASGPYAMDYQECDFGELVQILVADRQLAAADRGLALTLDVEAGLPVVVVDVAMLTSAINNLIWNAIKYTPAGGRVDVSLRRQAMDFELRVQDTGIGVPKEEQERIFYRHVRVNSPEHRRVKGTGLGLFIVASAATSHGGSCWVESEPGAGSVFIFRIPIGAAISHLQ
jgi:signal transduction histidine kinase